MVQYKTIHVSQSEEMRRFSAADMLDVSSNGPVGFITPDFDYEGVVIPSGRFHTVCCRYSSVPGLDSEGPAAVLARLAGAGKLAVNLRLIPG